MSSLQMDNQNFNVQPNSHPTTINGMPSVGGDMDEKLYHTKADVEATSLPIDDASDIILYSEREIATHVISVDDDPCLNPWTFRAFFLGVGLSAFGGSLGTIVSFK